ncbi:YihY/virulence factor BrkB family protein [Reichenbachiella versicolor]|uniref:YihY/virulence factor BrkB family protein n=1 Tax=Reichenbachiella versicolor TaxID=1821036 RepID=UPI0013A5367D|nr:YihY/virulence factor BrkB family protein [Reichenbachiella versicolor]
MYFRWYARFIRKLQKRKLNKHRTNLYSTIVTFLDNVTNNDLAIKASGVAFSFTLAIFPSIIFIFTLIPYIHQVFPHVSNDSILSMVASVMPSTMYESVEGTILDIIQIKRQGLLSFGAILAMALSTNGMHGLMKAFNSIFKQDEKRSVVKTRMISAGLTLMMSSVLFFSIFLLVIGKTFLDYLQNAAHVTDDFIIYLLFFVKYSIIGLSLLVAVSSVYYFAPAIHDRWTFFSSGAIFSAIAIGVVSYGFSVYINNFAGYHKFYGSIGIMIALMIWLYLLAYILLLGFEYNASVSRSIHSNKIEHTTSIFD